MSAFNQTCPVTGNSDLYGLGIRVGIYIQMITVQLSGLASAILKTEDVLGQGTIIFVLATGIVLIMQINENGVEPVEVYPILTLLLAQVGVCRVPYWKGQTTALIYTVEVVGLIAMFAWFWWHGMDTLPRTCPDDKAFFFAKVSIWHWFRTLNKVGSVFALIGGAVTVVFYLGAVIFFTFLRLAAWVQRFNGEDGQVSKEQQNPLGFGTADFLVNIGAIVYVEMALKWNGITQVHSLNTPGQFMPFFIALAQLFSVFYGVAKAGMNLAADDRSLSDSESEDEDEELPCNHTRKGFFSRLQPEELPLTAIDHIQSTH